MPNARKDEITWLPGAYYHLYNRGARRLSIFREPANYAFLLQRLKRLVAGLELSMIAYCLMPNHYHFLVCQNSVYAAGLLVQRAFNSYSKAYNKRYEQTGTLFERRYLAKMITDDAHLLHLCRYIHANPVKDGMVDSPVDWPYSNYAEWVGQRNGTLVDRGFIKQHFGTPQAYETFMEGYLRSRSLPESLHYLNEF